MTTNNKYFDTNRTTWDEKVKVHAESDMYDLEAFKKGKSSLKAYELEALGDVNGKSLLHLQCHFGQDTLSWSRKGAKCVGVDLSDEGIKLAKSLNEELNLDAQFVCCNVLDTSEYVKDKFDIVYTSYGVIGWLPDLKPWGQMIFERLKPGGTFYMAEFHPIVWMFDYLNAKEYAPKGEVWQQAMHDWQQLKSDPDASFDRYLTLEAKNIKTQVTWGTTPGQVTRVDSVVPSPEDFIDPVERDSCVAALKYMGLTAGTKITDIEINKVFIGSCTNSRIEDLRAAAAIAKGKQVSSNVDAIVVPGSYRVKEQAEAEGLAQIFIAAGFEWRLPGCSMCLGMNDDVLSAGDRCASTSNRNFEGRQGRGSRTHLVSPELAAASAIAGHFVDLSKQGKGA